MFPRLVLAFALAAIALGVLAVASLHSGATLSMAQKAPSGSDLPRTMSEMVPTQGWPWSLFGGRDSAPERWELPREPRGGTDLEEQSNEPRGRSGASGTYRTVCVRLCDGFHWPISHATTRDRFERDAKRCEQACPSRSRLFVHYTSDNDAPEMKDLKGGSYEKLENASRYQREYVPECTCWGNPWGEQALARHRGYAEAAAKKSAIAGVDKSRIEPQGKREQRGRGQKERWARSGWRDGTGNTD